MDKKPASADPPAEVGEGGGGGGGDPAQDPRNVAELTHYIQSMLQQMQDRWLRQHLVLGILQSVFGFWILDEIVGRFQTMSDQIITRIDDMSAR